VKQVKEFLNGYGGSLVAVFVLVVSVIVTFSNVKSETMELRKDSDRLSSEFKAHCESAQDVQIEQTVELKVIKNEIEHIHKSLSRQEKQLKETTKTVDDVNSKLDILLRDRSDE